MQANQSHGSGAVERKRVRARSTQQTLTQGHRSTLRALACSVFATSVLGTISAAAAQEQPHTPAQAQVKAAHQQPNSASSEAGSPPPDSTAKTLPANNGYLPLIESEPGFDIHQSLRLPDWLSVTVSGLSQNNGTVSGLTPAQATSSNLFNLGIQIGPFLHPDTLGKASETPEVPRTATPPTTNEFWRRWAVNALLTQRLGGVLSNELPNILNLQNNYGNGPIARLNSLSLQYYHPEGLLSSVKAGKLMQAQDFTVNPIQCYFSNFGLCGWAQGTPNMVPIPGNPFNSYGAVVELGNSHQARLKYGIYQLAPATFAPKYHGLNFRLDQGIGTAHFVEGSIPIATPHRLPVITDQSSKRVRSSLRGTANAEYQTDLPPGVLTLGGWVAQGRFDKVAAGSGGAPSIEGGQNKGVYGIASLRLPLDAIALDNRVFLAAGAGLNPAVQQFSSGGNAGLVLAGVLANRPFDTLSLGMSYAIYNPSFYLSTTQAGAYTPQGEYALELNYNISINRAVNIMPNIQVIINPAGNNERAAVLVAGLQVWLSF
jgi:carbohydrate-selective porin OprB